MQASPLWAGTGFRNQHPVLAGLRDPSVAMPSIRDFLCGGTRRVPLGPLPSVDPRQAWLRGDTGLTTEYQTIARRLGPVDLVMLEVGAFHPAWGDIHLGPAHALEAHALLGGGAFLPVHWGTFSLAMHAWDEPAETLLALAPRTNAPLLMPRLGEAVEPSRLAGVTPWWRGVDEGRPALPPVPAEAVPEALPKALPKGMVWPAD